MTIGYFNICSGALWEWGDFPPESRFGVWLQRRYRDGDGPACDYGWPGTISSTWLYLAGASPAGYGFTGSVGLFAADDHGCPQGAALAEQPFLPAVTGWQLFEWDEVYVPNSFAVVYSTGPGQLFNPMRVATDQASAIAPDGKPACGSCFPVDRPAHSYLWGTVSSPACPGQPFDDGTCSVELVHDTIGFVLVRIDAPVSVEATSWGGLKALYR
ncbi:MAG: hypothetical protein KC591_06275 [Gemmatimonadetes bacterium]|nr:hypothetical protein [Gemmatimonadota bacterium]